MAIAQTPLTPTGKVVLNGELWDAKCPSGAQAGETVVVKSVDGLQLTVDHAAEKVNKG